MANIPFEEGLSLFQRASCAVPRPDLAIDGLPRCGDRGPVCKTTLS